MLLRVFVLNVGQPIQGGEEAFTERRAEKLEELNVMGKETQGKLRDYDTLIKESKAELANITKRKDDLLTLLQDTNEKPCFLLLFHLGRLLLKNYLNGQP